MDDNSIIELYFDRNEEAITRTEEKYGRFCYSIAFNILRDHEDSQESVNDTYLKAWCSIPPRRPQELAAFLGKIVRHISIDRWRERNAHKRGSGEVVLALEELDECLAGVQGVDQEFDRREVARIYVKFLDSLPDAERRVFLCRYWFVESIEIIAAKFGFSQSKVKSMLHRSRRKFRRLLLEEGY